MKFGLGTNRGFVTVLCMSYFMVISFVCSVHMMILENRMSFYSEMERMDQQVHFEVLIMQRLKDSFNENVMQDCVLYYQDLVAEITFYEDYAIVMYSNEQLSYQRKYTYDINSGSLRINASMC